MKHDVVEPVPVGQTPETAPANDTSASGAAPKHDKEMARKFLAGLDPNADRFTFQFFGDRGGRHAEVSDQTFSWKQVDIGQSSPPTYFGDFETRRSNRGATTLAPAARSDGRTSKEWLCPAGGVQPLRSPAMTQPWP
jgi:hypothetical protein